MFYSVGKDTIVIVIKKNKNKHKNNRMKYDAGCSASTVTFSNVDKT